MTNFRYQALNAEQQLVTGELQADTVQQAVADLEARGLTVQSIGTASSVSAVPAADADSGDVTPSRDVEQAVLQSHMGMVLERGRVITPALRAYAEEMPGGRRRRELIAVCDVLDLGDTADATKALTALPECWIPLLSAATLSRDPGRVLDEFLDESQRADDLRRQWWQTLSYPFLVGGLAFAVLAALSLFVIPIFRLMFEDFELELPALTKWMLTLSSWIASGWMVVTVLQVVVLGAILFGVRHFLPESARVWLRERFRLPWGRRTAIARFARFTADLLEAGLDIPDALRIAGFTTTRLRLRRAAWRLANELESGRGGREADRRPLTSTVLYALQCEMPLASRIRLLKEISCCHAERVRLRLSWTRGIIEPVTILVIGIVVGGIVVALYLPLVKLVEGLT